MQTPVQDQNTPSEVLASWERARSDEELFSFINRRSLALGDLDDDDFELAAI